MVSESSEPDLFFALKGGFNNFVRLFTVSKMLVKLIAGISRVSLLNLCSKLTRRQRFGYENKDLGRHPQF
jgi:hypothetical protein